MVDKTVRTEVIIFLYLTKKKLVIVLSWLIFMMYIHFTFFNSHNWNENITKLWTAIIAPDEIVLFVLLKS